MITIIQLSWIKLRRDRVALSLSFLLPVIFFSIFAVILGGRSGGPSTRPIPVALVDLDQSELSVRFIDQLQLQDGLKLKLYKETEGPQELLTLADAEQMVRSGKVPVAVVFPAEFEASFSFSMEAQKAVTVLFDAADPVAKPMVSGLLQAAAFKAAPDFMMRSGMEAMALYCCELTEPQKAWMNRDDVGQAASASMGDSGLVKVETTDIRSEQEEPPNLATYYAAGIGVMFLLFSMVGAGGSLLEEDEAGTLERILLTRVGMTQVLLGKWLFYALQGFAQLSIMFIWGWLVFDVDLMTTHHLLGFVIVTAATAMAASGFGVLLATIAKTRDQLGGLSTVVVLVMSALGGSMIPRFVMPAFMELTSKFTLNGWAIDGFLKIFWYDDPAQGLLQFVSGITLEVSVLCLSALVFLVLARRLAEKWQVA